MDQNDSPTPIYGISFNLPGQRAVFEQACLKSEVCGHGILAMVNDAEFGHFTLCRQPKEKCPKFEKEMDEPFCILSDGRPFIIRKLKEVNGC